MQSIVYTGPSAQVETQDGTEFPIGIAVPVSDELAAGLLIQGCFLTAADYAARQAANAAPIPAQDVTVSTGTAVSTAPIVDPTPDN